MKVNIIIIYGVMSVYYSLEIVEADEGEKRHRKASSVIK